VIALLLSLLFAASAAISPVDEAALQKLVAANRGKVVFVNFWATWCAPCRAEMPRLLAFAKENEAKGVKLVVVSADEFTDAEKASQFLDTVKAPAPRYIKKTADDEKFINSMDPKWSGALPATFVYDRAGKKLKSFFGEVTVADLQGALKAAR
jgi:thiol-disulfide isomerase/thioredoxin